MGPDTPIEVDFVIDEYVRTLERFATGQELSREAAERAYRGHCEELRGAFVDGTPADVIRRIAFHRLEWEPPAEAAPSAPDGGVGTEAGSNPSRSTRE